MNPQTSGRVFWIDLARVAALAGMVVFHFARDLEIFSLVPPGLTMTGPWAILARVVASSFLFLSGVSFVLAHGRRVRWEAWCRRTGILAAAALSISAVTFVVVPDRFIYFGILHCIAACSLIGLAFLRAYWPVSAGVALLIIWLERTQAVAALQSPWLAWTGLTSSVPPALDFLPLVPWLAPFLIGIAFAQGRDLRMRVPAMPETRSIASIRWVSRNSLAIYLLHQPLLLAAIWWIVKIQ